MIHHSNSTGN